MYPTFWPGSQPSKCTPSRPAEVVVHTIDLPSEGRLHLGTKVTDLGNGRWHYEYALHNLNSDRAVRAFGVTVPGGVNVTAIDQQLPRYLGGEPYPSTPWATGVKAGFRYWASRSFAQNPDANSLRWSTTANFAFEADSPPVAVTCGVELFKPGTPRRVFFQAIGPQ